MRNRVNRTVNCETANISKTVNAAVRQIEDIHFIDERLTKDALIRACECADSNTIKHYRPDGSECFSVDKGYYLAEILYRGTTTDSGIIVDAWLKSTTHRNVILDASYSHSACGIAMVQGSDGYYYCCIGFR